MLAFAVVYEGRPGENPSGGKNAAPIVKAFFEPLKDEIKEIIAPAPKALEVIDESIAAPKAQEVTPEEAAEGVMQTPDGQLLDTAPPPSGNEADVEPIPRALEVDPSEIEEPTEIEEPAED